MSEEYDYEIEVDGEDYKVAIRNLKDKYGNDRDIDTIIKFCEQWQYGYSKMESSRNRLIIELTKLEAKYGENILDKVIEDDKMK